MKSILFVFLPILVLGVNCVVIHLKDGDINGTTTRTKEGRLFHKFLGIPYAKPPVNELRFQCELFDNAPVVLVAIGLAGWFQTKPPVPVEPWSGIKDVTQPPPICVQEGRSSGPNIRKEDCLQVNVSLPDPPVPLESWTRIKNVIQPPPARVCVQNNVFSSGSNIGQEDCLHLNVYIPDELLKSSGRVPVIVGIHGGGFQGGSANNYPGDYFMERDVIFVSINYRLGALGFLALNGDMFNTSNDLISGNFGLKDQSLALRWVNENIAQFGGDPANVTLIGQSAGGISAHFHMFSPLSKGLFQKAILQSNNAFSPGSHFPTDFKIKHGEQLLRLDQYVALQYLNKTNCLNTSDKLKCLQSKPIAELPLTGRPFYLQNQPIVESNVTEGLAFLPNEPNATNYQTLVPWIIGINSHEGGAFSSILLANGSSYAKLINSDKEFHLPRINQYLSFANESDLPEITKAVHSFYFGTEEIGLETALETTKMMTDSSWLFGLMAAVTAGPNLQYIYLYDHRGSFSFADGLNLTIDLGVCHGDELPLLFRNENLESKRSIEDRRVSNTLLKYWINFAISGDPNRHSKEKLWQPMQTKNQHFEYLHIKSDGVTMEKDLYQDRYNFWKSLPISWYSGQ